MRNGNSIRWVWAASLACFIVAALTGAGYRAMIASGQTFGFNPVYVRHGHSHLMYFGWITPVLMAGFVTLHRDLFSMSFVRRVMVGVFVAAAASYPMFLFFGYSLMRIGSAEMPVAVIVSSLNMIAWYTFVVHYAKRTRGIERTRSMLLFDVALTFLVLATLGAWALALLQPLGIDSDAWTSALTHIFLDLFSEGWFVVGVLALMYGVVRRPLPRSHPSFWLICAGLPLTFALGMPRALVPDELAVMTRVGSLLVGAGLVWNVLVLWRLTPDNLPAWMWRFPLAMLGLKALGQVAVGLTPGLWWTSVPGFRILYLHLMLLGFASAALLPLAERIWDARFRAASAAFITSIVLLLASLLPLTPMLPPAMYGRWVFVAAAVIAPLPAFAATVLMMRELRRVRLNEPEEAIDVHQPV